MANQTLRNHNTPCPLCGSEVNAKFDPKTSAWCVPCSTNEIRIQEREPHPFYNPYSAREVRRKDK